MKAVKVSTPLTELVSRYESLFSWLDQQLIERTSLIEAISMALLCKGHVLIEGPPGVAKSMLAQGVFNLFEDEDLVTFKKQLFPNTQAEELCGPLDVPRYRKEATWHFNTARMLPQAHFAFLDEFYRASDSLLPVLLGIFNEREFCNGPNVQKCPLIMGIGTTNFKSDRPELAAVHDRWLMRIKADPLSSTEARRKLLKWYFDPERKVKCSVEGLNLAELSRLNKAVDQVSLSEEYLKLYEDLVSRYRSGVGNLYISDRRLLEAARVMKAACLLFGHGELFADDPSEDVFFSAFPALLQEHTDIHTGALENAMQSVIGIRVRRKKEEPEIVALEKQVKRMIRSYDSSLSKKRKEALVTKITESRKVWQTLPADQQFIVPEFVQRFTSCMKKLDNFCSSILPEGLVDLSDNDLSKLLQQAPGNQDQTTSTT